VITDGGSAKHTRRSLAGDARRLGVEAGDTLFVHSSFKSLGPVEGGAPTVISALEDAVGSGGLLLMPSFNLVPQERRAATWNLATTPSTVGYLTEFFRLMPGTVRSDHYSHSVAARGRGAVEFVRGHLDGDGPESPWDLEPWGRTYGTQSPFMKAYRCPAGKMLMLGTDHKSVTYCHFVEVLFWAWRRSLQPDAGYDWINREEVFVFWDALQRQNRDWIGEADCRLFLIRDFVDTVLEAAKEKPRRFFKWYQE
jgi:aminoglycoside N3'-acetyltransferase